MSAIEKWADRVYGETDFGRNIATSLSGLLGLGVYLYFGDWVIAAFAAIIFFPVARITASAIHLRLSRNALLRAKQCDALRTFDSLSEEERAVVSEFANAGGCVLTWSQMNNCCVSASAIESLIQRDLLSTSMTADGMRETFVLEPAIFDAGVSHAKSHAGRLVPR
ncbi:MAG: hypothetical protein H6R14_25 [Proteobacteria bacterium]|nr:hypothetical protein [Pseudomonadota bacterium]